MSEARERLYDGLRRYVLGTQNLVRELESRGITVVGGGEADSGKAMDAESLREINVDPTIQAVISGKRCLTGAIQPWLSLQVLTYRSTTTSSPIHRCAFSLYQDANSLPPIQMLKSQ